MEPCLEPLVLVACIEAGPDQQVVLEGVSFVQYERADAGPATKPRLAAAARSTLSLPEVWSASTRAPRMSPTSAGLRSMPAK